METTAARRAVALAIKENGYILAYWRLVGRFFALLTLLLGIFFFAPHAEASHKRTVPVTIDRVGTVSSFKVELENDTGGITVAAGQNSGDIVIGNGYDNAPKVRFFSADGVEKGGFAAFDADMKAGITVAACDVDGDGDADVVTGKQAGGDPEVRIYNKEGKELPGGRFMAYDAAFRGGVNVACGDTDGDGAAEIVTAPGPTGGPHIRVWKLSAGQRQDMTDVFSPDSTGSTPSDGTPSVLKESPAIPEMPPETPVAYRDPSRPDDLSARPWHLVFGYVQMAAEPISLAATESVPDAADAPIPTWFVAREYFDGDHADTRGRLVQIEGGAVITEPMTGAHAYERLTHTVSADINQDGAQEKIFAPGNYLEANPALHKEIVVDVSDQRLYAYENGVLARSFFVSTGSRDFPTPVGVSSVLEKDPSVNYQWSYGPDNPNNYDLGVLPDNLRFGPHVFIHYAYWHNDFGHRRSHGCVNVNKENNKWVYNWADQGIRMEVRE